MLRESGRCRSSHSASAVRLRRQGGDARSGFLDDDAEPRMTFAYSNSTQDLTPHTAHGTVHRQKSQSRALYWNITLLEQQALLYPHSHLSYIAPYIAAPLPSTIVQISSDLQGCVPRSPHPPRLCGHCYNALHPYASVRNARRERCILRHAIGRGPKRTEGAASDHCTVTAAGERLRTTSPHHWAAMCVRVGVEKRCGHRTPCCSSGTDSDLALIWRRPVHIKDSEKKKAEGASVERGSE